MASTHLLNVSYHCLPVADMGSDGPMSGREFRTGLVEALPHGGAVVWTGIHTGDVQVTVDARTAPVSLETDGWDEVAEVSLTSPTGDLRLLDQWTDRFEDYPQMATAGAGTYRLRCHARGRDLNPDGVGDEGHPSEHYLLSIWPAPPTPDVVHKATDACGRGLRDSYNAAHH